MAQLRSPGGCPWDRKQTFDSLKPYLLEETYEALEAIDRRDWEGLKEELGDLLLEVVFLAQVACDEGLFDISDALDVINNKLVRRHPHVFGDSRADTAEQVRVSWDQIKERERKEKGRHDEGLLSTVSRSLPALVEAQKLTEKASKVGFDWDRVEEVLEKLNEELEELQRARQQGNLEAIEDEIGDLLFVVANLARFLQVDAEQALRKTNLKFRLRFAYLEQKLKSQNKDLREASLEEMEHLWQEAKKLG